MMLLDAEGEHAAGGIDFRKPDLDLVAHGEYLSIAFANESVMPLVMEEHVVAQRRDRHEALRTGFVQRDEQAETLHTRHAAMKPRARALLHIERHIARMGAPLRIHRLALARGNALAEISEFRMLVWPTAFPAEEFFVLDQETMDDQVGITADRRCKMRVTAQIETEMADILGAVDGLCLRAQNQCRYLLAQGRFLDALQKAGEVGRLVRGS